ncbi:hypothetical protein B7P43_G13694 [Cryptotermes secundus]|uniref:Uncharacterized protein n=1 Tax=Cryptotermes secundus TaxID=105785 RepID=A0A2J7PVF2_9NEOP|nr:hypothetical protein B7P43_G13694 [Cryptotermes secundus]
MGYSVEIADTKKLHQEGRTDVMRCCSVESTVKRYTSAVTKFTSIVSKAAP